MVPDGNSPVRRVLYVPAEWDWKINCMACGTEPRPQPPARPEWLEPPASHFMHVAEAGNEDLDCFAYEDAPDCLDQLKDAIGPHGLHGYNYARRQDVPCYGGSGVVTRLTGSDDDAKLIALPGLRCFKSTVELLAWPHGPLNVCELSAKAAGKRGLEHSFRRRLHNANFLAGRVPIDDKYAVPFVPAGMYKHATGATLVWEDNFTVAVPWLEKLRRRWWGRKRTLAQRAWRMHLRVLGATWTYTETADCETRIWLSAAAQSQFTFLTQLYDWPAIAYFRKLADELARELQAGIQAQPVSEVSGRLRLSRAHDD